MFTLKIETGNAAFGEMPNERNADCAYEIARILRQCAKQLDAGRKDSPLYDINGNRVGEWSLRD
jgi:hypothetical protein